MYDCGVFSGTSCSHEICGFCFEPKWLGQGKPKAAFQLPKHGFADAAVRRSLQVCPATATLPAASPLSIRVVRNSTTDCFHVSRSTQDPPWFLHLSSLLLSRLLSNKKGRRQTDLCDMLGAKLCGVGLVSVQTLVIVFQPWHSWVVDLFCRWTSIELVIFDVANRAPLLITTLVPATCNEFRSVRWMILPRMFHSDNNSVTKWTFHPCHDGFILTSHVMVWLCNTPMQSGFLKTFWVVASK